MKNVFYSFLRITIFVVLLINIAPIGLFAQPQDHNFLARPVPMTAKELAVHDAICKLFIEGNKAMALGEYSIVEKDSKAAMDLGFAGTLMQNMLAAALNKEGKTTEALAQYHEMYNENDDDPHDLIPYAMLSLNNGNIKQAAAAYNRAVPFLGGDPKLIQEFGFADVETISPEELAVDIHIASGIIADSSCDWDGKIHYDNGLSEFEAAVKQEPNLALAHYYYGYGLAQVHRMADAKAEYQKAADLGNDDVKAAAEEAMKGQ